MWKLHLHIHAFTWKGSYICHECSLRTLLLMVSTVQALISEVDEKILCVHVKSDTDSQLSLFTEQQCRKSKGLDNPLAGFRTTMVGFF